MAGRKAKPDAVKRAQGTLQKCRTRNKVDMILFPGVPPPPSRLSAVAKKIYADTASELMRIGLLQKIGLPLVIMYCQQAATAMKAYDKYTKLGEIVQTKKGPKVSPWYNIALKSMEASRKMATEFGITPSAQAKVASLINTSRKVDEAEKDF